MFKRGNEINNLSENKNKRSKFYDYKHKENKSFIVNQLENKINPDLEKVKQLLKQGIFSNLRDTKGRSILEIACQNPFITLEIFQLLIDNGNPVVTFERVIHDEEQLIMPSSIADKLLNDLCRNENIHFDIIKWLVEKYDVEPNAMIAGSNSLYCICSNNEVTLEIIKYLIEKGANPSPATELLRYICRNDNANLDIIKYFVDDLEADHDKRDGYGKNLLDWVCDSETLTLETIEYLIEQGANIKNHVICKGDYDDDIEYTAVSPVTDLLHYICYKGNIDLEIIKFLVEKYDADVNATVFDGENLLYWICGSETVTLEDIKYVIDKGANIEQSAATDLLHFICSNSNIDLEIIKYFIDNFKVDPKATVDKRNLLHWACASKTVTLPVIKYLIENKVNLKKDDVNEDSPVHLFFKKYLKKDAFIVNREMTHYLLDQNIDVDAIDGQLQTILHIMSRLKEMDLTAIYKVIEKSKRSSLTLIDEYADRPLDAAYGSNNQDAFILLLLLRWRDVGLESFVLEQYDDQQPDESDSDPNAFYEKRQAMRQLINAAQNSKAAFEEELDRGGYLDKFPAECLKKLALDGCLSKTQLIKLKERNIFVKDNVKYFSKATQKDIFTFFCCMKVVNNERLQLGWKMPKQLLGADVLREILHNQAQSIREVKAKEESSITIGLNN